MQPLIFQTTLAIYPNQTPLAIYPNQTTLAIYLNQTTLAIYPNYIGYLSKLHWLFIQTTLAIYPNRNPASLKYQDIRHEFAKLQYKDYKIRICQAIM